MKKLNFTSIILGAGLGSRMKSTLPKIMHRIGGAPFIDHILKTLQNLECDKICLITAPSMDKIRKDYPTLNHIIQEVPKGTGHAVLYAESFINESHQKPILILYGDTPLISPQTLENVLEESKSADIVLLGMRPENPKGYGRIVVNTQGFVTGIIEDHEASPQELENNLCWSGIMTLKHKDSVDLLKSITNDNKKQEYYLTDIIEIACSRGLAVKVIEGPLTELEGVNTRQDLAKLEATYQRNRQNFFMDNGVSFMDPASVHLSFDTILESDITLEPSVFFGLGVHITSGVHIKAFSYLEGVKVQNNAVIGPYARIRGTSVIEPNCKIGNFVEIKNSHIQKNSKISHLSYIGDTTMGQNVNVGAGTITCNYNGVEKFKTVIKDNVFIGANSALIAPLIIETNALIAAGSTITKNVPSDMLALSRSPQIILKKKDQIHKNQDIKGI